MCSGLLFFCISLVRYDMEPFHMLICYLCIFFREMSVQVFGPFVNQVVLLLSSLYILDNSTLSDLQIFSPSL